jgi:hypothetical protein
MAVAAAQGTGLMRVAFIATWCTVYTKQASRSIDDLQPRPGGRVVNRAPVRNPDRGAVSLRGSSM